MAITTFIPTVWSETLLEGLNQEYIGVKHCNRDFEGDIKGKGSSVKIGSVGEISVFDYEKDTDMTAPQALNDAAVTLEINQAKAFNFQIDDIDRAQANPRIMQAAMKQAANSLAAVADEYVYNVCMNDSNVEIIKYEMFLKDFVAEMAINARRKLIENGVNSNVETVLEVNPATAYHILQAQILDMSCNNDVYSNGLIGKLMGFEVYVSNSIPTVEASSICFARTKRAVAFAEQLNEVEAYRPENRFADAVKGLHLYGAKVVYPNEIIRLDLVS